MKKRILAFSAVLLLLLSLFPVSIFATDTSSGEELITDLSQTTIEDDFEKVFNNSFNVDSYDVDTSDTDIHLIALTEYENALGEIEIYVYIYNPSQRTFYEYGTNMITLSYENETALFDNYEKYSLERIDSYNYTKDISTETNGTILKYKVNGITVSDVSNQRAYAVSEIELRLKNGVLSFPIGKSFIFTKQSDGTYDIFTNEQNVIVIDELGHTFYSVQSSNPNVTDDIRTVYFAVDRSIVDSYGIMTTVDCSWQEKTMQPILLLDDKSVVSDFKSIAGTSNIGNFQYGLGIDMRPGLLTGTNLSLGHFGTDFKMGFNTSKVPSRFYDGTQSYFDGLLGGGLQNFVWSTHFHNTYLDVDSGFDGEIFDSVLEKLYLTMYCSYENGARVSSEKLMNDLDKYDGILDDLYDDELFTDTVSNRVTFSIEDEYSLGKYEITSSFLNDLLNFKKFDTDYADEISYSRFELFNDEHLELSDGALSNRYLIDKNDIDNFREFAEENQDSYIYFLRYAVTETTTYEASVFGGKDFTTGTVLGDALIIPAECYVCNGSLVESVFINDFDIITLGFNDINGTYTIVPVSTVPTDSTVDLTQIEKKLPPEKETSEWDEFIKTLVKIVTIAILIVSIFVVFTIVLIVVLVIRFFRKRKVKNSEKKNN